MLQRIIRILSAFDTKRPNMSIATLASRADIPVPTCYRLVNQMVEEQLLRKDTEGNVGLGMRLWELSSRSSPAVDLRMAAMPFLDDVQSVFRQHVQLAILEQDEVLVIERLSSRNSVINQANIATRMPIHAVSMGLALLAFQPTKRIEEYLQNNPAAAERCYPDTGDIHSTLAHIRRQGYCQLDGQLDAETTGAAVPVFAALEGRGRKEVIATIGVVVPRTFEQRNALGPVLLAASRGLTRTMSGK